MGKRPNPISAKFMQYVVLQRDIKEHTARLNSIKKELAEFAEGVEPDDKGHYAVDMPATDGATRFLGFMRQRRVSQSFNADRAEELLTARGVSRREFISTTEYVDQDKVARLYAEDRITDDEFNSLLDTNISYAFVTTKE